MVVCVVCDICLMSFILRLCLLHVDLNSSSQNRLFYHYSVVLADEQAHYGLLFHDISCKCYTTTTKVAFSCNSWTLVSWWEHEHITQRLVHYAYNGLNMTFAWVFKAFKNLFARAGQNTVCMHLLAFSSAIPLSRETAYLAAFRICSVAKRIISLNTSI